MDYDYRNRAAPPYESHAPVYNRPATGHGSSFYPKIGQSGQPMPPPSAARSSSLHPNHSPPSLGLGIRVAIKPDYRITPPPQLAPLVGDIPRSTFEFNFDFERKILAEAEKERQNWNRIAMESPSSKTTESTSLGSSGDPVVNKYVASGLGREAVILAVANYGDNPAKVREFVNAYNLLREMGFSSKNVAEVLAMYDNDTDKALAHFLNSSS
ncbi:Ubiquitin-associated 1 [Cinnamomum micranthum f. kanehirae]|uniref:Ubiquitin-associated 1 n=1 Tax=Cinnamomum micranthum f. kanehirae TaxID=337451 RepID=A0A3S3NIA7_9MAGN|nr:Ubiquitin-associated 1 [Cinnamomum micranthum f. kanehirae]